MNISTARSRKLLLASFALVALAFPTSALAQATRTWVSGVGDDANPCSRTAPCKTFAGAISKTAAGGEINVLDPGGFGAVTITKSITIDGLGFNAGVLVSGTNGIVISAAATDTVTLRGLDIDGLGTGLNGVRILAAKNVTIQNSEIYGFTQNAVDMEDSTSGAKLTVLNNLIVNNTGDGVLVAPPSGGNSTATVRNNWFSANGCGLASSSHGAGSGTCGTDPSATGAPAKINAFDNTVADSTDSGVFSNGPNSIVRIGANEITANVTGLKTADVGSFGGIYSFGDNFVWGNGTNGTPTGTLAHV
jgi:Right handed beta helix region